MINTNEGLNLNAVTCAMKKRTFCFWEEGALSQMEARIYAVIAGFLQLPLSAAKQTDDRLWCYINSAIECRLDAKFAKCHPAECPLDDVNVKNDDLSVDSIFDEISTVTFCLILIVFLYAQCQLFVLTYKYVLNEKKRLREYFFIVVESTRCGSAL